LETRLSTLTYGAGRVAHDGRFVFLTILESFRVHRLGVQIIYTAIILEIWLTSALGLQEDNILLGYRKVLVLTFRELESLVQVGQKCGRCEYERHPRVTELMKLFGWCTGWLSQNLSRGTVTHYAQLIGETLRPAQ
jgi:bacterioferritin-associated ferredoxin